MSFLNDEEQVEYIKDIVSNIPKFEDFSDKFLKTDPALQNILKQMLEFNPYFRPSAKQLLQNPIFDDLRQKNNENAAPFKIKLFFDKNSLACDHSNSKVDNSP